MAAAVVSIGCHLHSWSSRERQTPAAPAPNESSHSDAYARSTDGLHRSRSAEIVRSTQVAPALRAAMREADSRRGTLDNRWTSAADPGPAEPRSVNLRPTAAGYLPGPTAGDDTVHHAPPPATVSSESVLSP